MFELREAILQVAREDIGPGSLTDISGNSDPLIMPRALTPEDLPRGTLFVIDEEERQKKGTWNVVMQFAYYGHPSNGVDYQGAVNDMVERTRLIMKPQNFLQHGIDVAPIPRRVQDAPVDDEAIYGRIFEMLFFNASLS